MKQSNQPAILPTIVFGVSHSPWTQAVVLAMAANNTTVKLRAHPTFGYYLKHGLIMPSCLWSNGNVSSDSLKIIQMFEENKNNPFPVDEDTNSNFKQLEKLFLSYAVHRTGPHKRLAFIDGWSKMRETPQTPLTIVGRALMCWYFFILIEAGRFVLLKRFRNRSADFALHVMLERFSTKLGDAPFFDGKSPGPTDFGLLGQVECLSSGLTDWAMDVFHKSLTLVEWLKRMHLLVEHHPTVFSRRIFRKNEWPPLSKGLPRYWFYVSFLLIACLFPISLPVLIFAFYRRKDSIHRSGGRLIRSNRAQRNV